MLILFITVVLVGLNVTADDHSRSVTEVTGESITVDYSQPTPVDIDAVRYSDTVTITNADDNTLTAGIDYTWNASTGEVTWINTPATTDGDPVSIDYGYYKRSQETDLASGVLSPLIKVVALMVIMVAVYGAYKFAAGGGTGGGL